VSFYDVDHYDSVFDDVDEDDIVNSMLTLSRGVRVNLFEKLSSEERVKQLEKDQLMIHESSSACQ
jgi:hypothetical protein